MALIPPDVKACPESSVSKSSRGGITPYHSVRDARYIGNMSGVEENLSTSGSWWGRAQVEMGQTLHWRIGPLQLWLSRLDGEWRVATLRTNDALDPTMQAAHGVSADEIPVEAMLERLGTRDRNDRLQLSPRLADRAVVNRPELACRRERPRLHAGRGSPAFVQ